MMKFGHSVINKSDSGVVIQVDNGDTHFLTHDEYKTFGIKKELVRFPNESDYCEMSIDWKEFSDQTEFDTETFGWYNGTRIAIKK